MKIQLMRGLRLILLVSLISVVSSCMTTKTQVGTYKEQTGTKYTYSKAKQLWLFWGIIPLGKVSANTPASGNCEVITKLTFADALLFAITGGIVSSYSVKVKAKKENTEVTPD